MKRLNNRTFIKNFGKDYYSKQITNLIYVLIIVLFVLITKSINSKITKNIINIIEKNIYYEFTFKEDGKKVKDYIIKTADNSINSIEKFTKDIIKIKNNPK